MSQVILRPMDESEFEPWKAESRRNYAMDKEKEGYSAEDAVKVADESFNRLLPQGIQTAGQHVYTVRDGDRRVGILWWGTQKKGSKTNAWIYDIMIHESERGKGFGRATMLAAEADARSKGMSELGLHVFGHNKIARGLYESLGFRTTNVVMAKDL